MIEFENSIINPLGDKEDEDSLLLGDKEDEDSLLPGWVKTTDDSGRTYYYHKETRKSQWDRPTAEISDRGDDDAK